MGALWCQKTLEVTITVTVPTGLLGGRGGSQTPLPFSEGYFSFLKKNRQGSNLYDFATIFGEVATSNIGGFEKSAMGNAWSFSGLFEFVNSSRNGEGWLDVACRAMQAPYWTNSRT